MLLRYIFIFLGLFLSNEPGTQNQCGIDVSRHQGRIEWQKVPIRDISFVYIKATEVEPSDGKGYSPSLHDHSGC